MNYFISSDPGISISICPSRTYMRSIHPSIMPVDIHSSPSMNHLWILLLLVSLSISQGDQNENPSRFINILKSRLEKRFLLDHRHFFNADEMLLFSDVAFPDLTDPSQWKVMIHGWRYQPSKTKHLLEVAANSWVEHLADQVLNATEILSLNETIKRERLRPFFFQGQFQRNHYHSHWKSDS